MSSHDKQNNRSGNNGPMHLLPFCWRSPWFGQHRTRFETGVVCLHRLGDVLDFLLTQELVVKGEFDSDRRVHGFGNANAPRLGQALQPRRHIDPVAVDRCRLCPR